MCYSLQKGAKYYIIRKQILAEELIHVPALYQLHPKASVEEPAAVCAENTERQEQGASGVGAASATALTSQSEHLKRYISLSSLHTHTCVSIVVRSVIITTHFTAQPTAAYPD